MADFLWTGEKQKEHKERAERDGRNQEHAGSSYRVPDPRELGPDNDELSGLPWGGVSSTYFLTTSPMNEQGTKTNMRDLVRHVVARGHESETRRGSARDTQTQDNAQYYNTYSGYHTSSSQKQQTASWGSRGSSGGDDRYPDDRYQDDQQYYYDYDNDYDQNYDHEYNPSGVGGSSYQT